MDRTLRKISAVPVIVLLLFGCASIESPPEHWPTPVKPQSDGCPDLSGSYNNHGSGVDEKHSGGSLATHIFPQAAKNWTKLDVEAYERFSSASHVTFYGPNKDGLTVEAWKSKELLGRIERQKDTDVGFRCDAGALVVSLPVYAQAMGGAFFSTFRTVAIMPAVDGSILVKDGNIGVGLGFYFIPVAMKFEGWALYPSTNFNKSNEESAE